MLTPNVSSQPDLHPYNIRLRAELDEATVSLSRAHRHIDEHQHVELPSLPHDPRVVMRLEHLRSVLDVLRGDYLKL
jgi:hypothetical protein